MKKLTKRIKAVQALYDPAKTYNLKESIAILKKAPNSISDEAIEVPAKLNIDPK